MEIEQFKQLVSRLEQESAASPAMYRAKVAGLTLVGFGILAVLLCLVGAGLLVLVGIVAAAVMTGGAALLLLLKLGKLVVLLAIPLWLLMKGAVKALFVRLPKPTGREITRSEAPALFTALDGMRRQMKGPRFHHVLVVDDMNAAVVQRPTFGLIGWPRNYLLLGLPLLEGMAPQEALAVVAHEYGHLAGQHGHFSAYIYRLRHTWGTIQAYVDALQGWIAKLVAPMVKWYAPYFNAYTFVLARGDEYLADAASARLVGAAHAMHALKRSNLVGPRHQAFLQETFDRIAHDPQPPADLASRWAERLQEPPEPAEAQRWLLEALDREAHFADTHPTLRARLQAMAPAGADLQALPPDVQGPSAAAAWFGPGAQRLRDEFQLQWAARVQAPWREKHAAVQQMRGRLVDLQSRVALSVDEQLEMFKLINAVEPETDQRERLAAFNAAHAEAPVPLGLFLEACARLDHDDRSGLALLDRVMELDPEATKPACERAHAFLHERKEADAAEQYAQRWRNRDALESQREHQLKSITPGDVLCEHDAPAHVVASIKAKLEDPKLRKHVAQIYLARRVIRDDPTLVAPVLAVRLTWWGAFTSQGKAVVRRLAAIEWPMVLVVVTMEQEFKAWRKKVKALPQGRLV